MHPKKDRARKAINGRKKKLIAKNEQDMYGRGCGIKQCDATNDGVLREGVPRSCRNVYWSLLFLFFVIVAIKASKQFIHRSHGVERK